MTQRKATKVAIVGGGIAGLGLALNLRRRALGLRSDLCRAFIRCIELPLERFDVHWPVGLVEAPEPPAFYRPITFEN